MGKPLDWRRIEKELIEISKGNGFILDTNEAGDNIISIESSVDPDVNLTEVAKELAERLA